MIESTFIYAPEYAAGKTPSLVVENVNVVYNAPVSAPANEKSGSRLHRLTGGVFGKSNTVSVHAVKDVSFISYRGDSIGFLGVNGAGKSSLLRVVAGNESPQTGTVMATSQPAILGVSAALLPDLSGYDNARLGCLALGLSPAETDAALPDILEFTELGDAIFRPMRSYSSGMGARLRFAISTVTKPDILIVDEALSTGDATFQEKSKARMDEMLSGTGTILLVSHSATQVEQMCNRAVWMHKGEFIADGPVDEVTEYYRVWARYLRTDKAKAQDYLDEVHHAYQPITIDQQP